MKDKLTKHTKHREKMISDEDPILKANHPNCCSNGFESTHSLNGFNVACCCKSTHSWSQADIKLCGSIFPSLCANLEEHLCRNYTLHIYGNNEWKDKMPWVICQTVVLTNFNLDVCLINLTTIQTTHSLIRLVIPAVKAMSNHKIQGQSSQIHNNWAYLFNWWCFILYIEHYLKVLCVYKENLLQIDKNAI